MKKRIFAVLLTALTAVSLAACNQDNKNTASGSNNNAEDNAASTVDFEQDETIKKAIEENFPTDKLSSKTKSVFEKFSSKDLKVELALKMDKAASESSENGGSMLSMLGDNDITLGFAKNGSNDMRITLNLGFMNLDVLKNSDGFYFLDSSSKTAILTKTQGDDSAASTGTETSEATDGSLLNGIDAGSLLDSTGMNKDSLVNSFAHTSDGEEEFNGATCSYEAYSIKVPGDSDEDSSQKENEVSFKVYFSGDDLKGFQVSSNDQKYNLVVNTLETKVDESEFKVPSEYEVKEDTDGTMMNSLFGGLLGMGMGADIPTAE